MVELVGADGARCAVSALTSPMARLGARRRDRLDGRARGGARAAARARARSAAVGVHPPERCVDPDDMFPELERRGCRFER